MRRLYIILVLILQIKFAAGQGSLTVNGRINDENGTALPGASVSVRGTQSGGISGQDGKYEISGLMAGNIQLNFSFVGYESVNVKARLSSDTTINVVLKPAPVMTDEVIVNATRAGENTPLAYTNVAREELKKANIGQDIPFLLSLTPSLVETSEAGTGIGYTGMRIRGTDANRINVTIDEIPLNDPESQTVFWVDLPDIASSVGNIQIQRGVGTSSNGSGAFGATVSLQTLNPGNDPFAEAGTSYGSFNTLKNTVSAGTGFLADKIALQLRYSDIKSDGYVDRTGSDHRSAFISGVYRNGRSRLKANIILGEEHTGIGWWGVPSDSLKTNRTYNPAGQYTDGNGQIQYYNNESDNYKQDHYQLIYNFRAGANLIMNAALHYTKGKGYYEEYREDQPLADYNLSPFLSGNQLITETDLIRRKWLDNDFYGLVYSLNYKKGRTGVTAGGGVNSYLGDHFGTVIWMRNAGNTEKDYQWYFNNSVKNELSVYGKLNYDLSEKTKLFGDIQYRHLYYRMAGIEDDLLDISQKHNFSFFNPKAGFFYNITPDQDAWISFAIANREPTREDFKEAAGDASATPKPERLYDTELGYKLRSGNNSFSVNLYGMYYKNQLVPTGQLSNVGYTIMTNVDKSYRMGIEAIASLRLADFLDLNSALTLSRNKILDFTEYYTDYNTTDWSSQYLSRKLGVVDIAYSPSVIWSGDLAAKAGIFDFHLIAKYVGKQYFDNTMSSARSIDPYFVTNLRLDIQPGIRNLKGLELQFLVNNLFNAEYENNAYGGNWYEDGIERTWSYFFPQAGINYMFRVAFSF